MLNCSYKTNLIEAGCDEAGRGCLAGPVFAAAVILPSGYNNPLLNDSKKLQEPVRNRLRIEIERSALSWAVGYADNSEIDDINILQASILAMHRALSQLDPCPQHILIDGNYFSPFMNVSHTCIIRGDGLYASIAAASVLAKTHRDEMMTKLHDRLPVYGWASNKGYPTKFHARALLEHGSSSFHRKSFTLRSGQH